MSMIKPTVPPARWFEQTQKELREILSEDAELVPQQNQRGDGMATHTGEINSLNVALNIYKAVTDMFGDCGTNPEVLEGMWLAMQMVGGPGGAARVIGYCAIKVD